MPDASTLVVPPLMLGAGNPRPRRVGHHWGSVHFGPLEAVQLGMEFQQVLGQFPAGQLPEVITERFACVEAELIHGCVRVSHKPEGAARQAVPVKLRGGPAESCRTRLKVSRIIRAVGEGRVWPVKRPDFPPAAGRLFRYIRQGPPAGSHPGRGRGVRRGRASARAPEPSGHPDRRIKGLRRSEGSGLRAS